jgi:hypothetical protein
LTDTSSSQSTPSTTTVLATTSTTAEYLWIPLDRSLSPTQSPPPFSHLKIVLDRRRIAQIYCAYERSHSDHIARAGEATESSDIDLMYTTGGINDVEGHRRSRVTIHTSPTRSDALPRKHTLTEDDDETLLSSKKTKREDRH